MELRSEFGMLLTDGERDGKKIMGVRVVWMMGG